MLNTHKKIASIMFLLIHRETLRERTTEGTDHHGAFKQTSHCNIARIIAFFIVIELSFWCIDASWMHATIVNDERYRSLSMCWFSSTTVQGYSLKCAVFIIYRNTNEAIVDFRNTKQ